MCTFGIGVDGMTWEKGESGKNKYLCEVEDFKGFIFLPNSKPPVIWGTKQNIFRGYFKFFFFF